MIPHTNYAPLIVLAAIITVTVLLCIAWLIFGEAGEDDPGPGNGLW